MTFKKYDRFGVLLLTGQYIASLDTLKSYTEQFDLTGEPLEIKVAKYFQPLRHGVWSYYENGILKRTENYQRGIPARDSK